MRDTAKEQQSSPGGPAGFGGGVALARPTGWVRTFSSLRNRNYRVFWIGIVSSFVAMQVQQVARGWLAYELTESPLALGGVMMASGIPMVLFSLMGGVIADRVDKRKLLIVTQSLLGIVAAALAILVAADLITFPYLVVSAILTGIIFPFNMPGRQAYLTDLVGEEDLMNALALNSAGMNITRIVTPGVAGVLIDVLGVDGAFFFQAACYVVAVVTLFMIPISGKVALKPDTPMWKDLVEGINHVRGSPVIPLLLSLELLVVTLAMPYQMLMPVFAVDVLGVGASGLGMLYSAAGVGGLVGALIVASLGNFRRKGQMLIFATLAQGVTLIFFALVGSYTLSLFFLSLVGFSGIAYMATNNTLIMTSVGSEARGRIMGIYLMGFGIQPLTGIPVGALAEAIGAPYTVAGGGALLIFLVLLMVMARPALRHLK
ncbi:MAG: MFS transporter [Chloroflexi bacterium]|nr:MFS transporter [Chloroflexota bacterium]